MSLPKLVCAISLLCLLFLQQVSSSSSSSSPTPTPTGRPIDRLRFAASQQQRQRQRFSTAAVTPSTTVVEDVFIASITPSNGDGNPYGVVFVPNSWPLVEPGTLVSVRPGDVLVSNFNNNQGQQGTGSTIVLIRSPVLGTITEPTMINSTATVFWQAGTNITNTRTIGLTTALLVLPSCGLVVVGNTPAPGGVATAAEPGSLFILNGYTGEVLLEFVDPLINGPWGATTNDGSTVSTGTSNIAVHVWVSNVLDGSIVRLLFNCNFASRSSPLAPDITATKLAEGFLFRTDPAALLIGPQGLLLVPTLSTSSSSDMMDMLVSDVGNNRIVRIHNVTASTIETIENITATGVVVIEGSPLNGPLALAVIGEMNGEWLVITGNGDALNSNSANLGVVFNAVTGALIAARPLATPPLGANFGLVTSTLSNGLIQLIHVDDDDNTVRIVVVSSCVTCTAGQYSTCTTSSTKIGWFLELAGNCSSCACGSYSVNGASSCTQCPAGHYSAAGASSCTACASGMSAPPGSCHCTTCQPGTCPPCQAGWSLSQSTGLCSPCNGGTYSLAGATTCLACACGTYSGDGATTCMNCLTNSYSLAGASQCISCQYGYVASPGSCACSTCPTGRSYSGSSHSCV